MSVIALSGLYAAIPSPSQSVWQLGPFPVRAYAVAILAGIFAAAWLTSKRWVARGGTSEQVINITFWAVPFGIVGGRIYHVFSSPEAYWGKGGDPISALYIWQGGLGIWGAIALGAVGAYIGCRKEGVRFSAFADAVAPGLLLAQALGRLGNWFNQELFGSSTTLPWGLEIDPGIVANMGYVPGTLFHPTFLYEMLWNLAAAALLLYLDKRFRLGYGRVFWAYVVLYTAGRLWIEMLRIDPAEQVLGLRLNVWTSILVLIGGIVAFVIQSRRHPAREDSIYLLGHGPEAEVLEDADVDASSSPDVVVSAHSETPKGSGAGIVDESEDEE